MPDAAPRDGAKRHAAPRWACALCVSGVALFAMLLAAAPAGAVISGTFGAQQREAPVVEGAPLHYHGGKVLHSSDAYVIYWDPYGSYRGDWERLIDKYFADVAADSGALSDGFAVDSQYRDGEGPASNQSSFRGSYKDTDPYPTTEGEGQCSITPTPTEGKATCITNVAIEKELHKVIQSVAPPLPGETGTPVYYILTPPEVTVCTGSGAGTAGTCSNSPELEAETTAPAKKGICGYHSFIGGSTPIPYVVQPWIAGDAGLFITSLDPLVTSEVTAPVLACQNDTDLQEPNQLSELNPFGNYAEGLADVIVNDLSIEQSDVVTDPFLNGWYQTTKTAKKYEQGDMCQFAFGPPPKTPPLPDPETHAANLADETINGDAYYLQLTYNSSGVTAGEAVDCWSGVSLEPYFTAPSAVHTEDYVGFNASESLITLDASPSHLNSEEPYVVPVYRWEWGDGTPNNEGSGDANEFHKFEYAGTYTVRLSITDGGGNTESAEAKVTVTGRERPAAGGSGGSGGGTSLSGGSSSAASSSSSSSTSSGASSSSKGPVASAAASSQTLSTALAKGLLVRYSVSEQVAGRVEVLLASSLAKRVGLHGPSVGGLPKGTPPQLLVGKGIVNATRGGHGTVKIQFGKVTAQRLRRLGKITLLLRMVVRNSAGHTSTVLTTVSLHP